MAGVLRATHSPELVRVPAGNSRISARVYVAGSTVGSGLVPEHPARHEAGHGILVCVCTVR